MTGPRTCESGQTIRLRVVEVPAVVLKGLHHVPAPGKPLGCSRPLDRFEPRLITWDGGHIVALLEGSEFISIPCAELVKRIAPVDELLRQVLRRICRVLRLNPSHDAGDEGEKLRQVSSPAKGRSEG